MARINTKAKIFNAENAISIYNVYIDSVYEVHKYTDVRGKVIEKYFKLYARAENRSSDLHHMFLDYVERLSNSDKKLVDEYRDSFYPKRG